ncbi:hypothetical protein QUB70_30245 [Microcoleus sp. A003_D6]|uniref:hypothetical protein n=1 Tax=Microcoleus sp. A003_D6 TaxID=3055266 RepID=UPI002FD6ED1E
MRLKRRSPESQLRLLRVQKNLWEKNLWELLDRRRAIDPDGRIEEVYRKVKPETHAAEILADLPDL